MLVYNVSATTLSPLPGYHDGTGHHQDRIWVVDSSSVPGSGKLAFLAADVDITTMLFQLDAAVVPNWFGVAVPHGIQDFTRPHIFFHPTPAQAGYRDSDYATKSGMWPQLFYYMERLGYQLDAAARSQIIVMPFITEAAKDTGILPANWLDIITNILRAVRTSMGADDGSKLDITQVVVSSFSAGLIYSYNFRRNAAGLAGLLGEVWDFDGRFSTYNWISQALQSTAHCNVIKYDQLYSSNPSSYHVPLPRWTDYVAPPTASLQVHGLIRDFMFRHGASVSAVGSLIGAAALTTGTTTASTATPGTAVGSAATVDTGFSEMPTGATGTTGSAYSGVEDTITGSATSSTAPAGTGGATEPIGTGMLGGGVAIVPTPPSALPPPPVPSPPLITLAPIPPPVSAAALSREHGKPREPSPARMRKGRCGDMAAMTASVSLTANAALAAIAAIPSRSKGK
jgi:hypothetical protein